MEAILGYALGDIQPSLAQDLTVTLPHVHLTGWSAREAATSTDGLLALAEHQETCPWTTLLVTPWLSGATSLEETLVSLHLRWPQLRIAVLLGAYTAEYQPLLKTLAAYQIYNCLIADEFQFPDLVNLITNDWAWEAVKPYLGRPHGMTVPPQETLPSRVALQRTDPVEPTPSTAIAVISAKGGSGKTGIVANCLWAAGRTSSSMAIDLDIRKASLPLYFRPADEPFEVNLHQLLTLLSRAQRGLVDEDEGRERLTPQDKQEVRAYVHRAVDVAPGARLIPGPLRQQAMTPIVPPGLTGELIRQAKTTAQTVWVDLPTNIYDPIWEEAVRTVDQLIVVTTPDAVSVLETLALFERLDHLRVPRSAVRLVVNHAGHGGLAPDEIAKVHLKHPVALEVPDQPKLWDAAIADHRPVAHRQARVWERFVAPLVPSKSQMEERAGERRRRREDQTAS